MQNPQLTDVRLERATATGASGGPPGSRWYQVTYLAEDPERGA